MDIVFIEDLKVQTVIGIYDWERQIRQTVSIFYRPTLVFGQQIE